MYHIFFTHSSADRHLGLFQVLARVHSADMNLEVHVSFWIMTLVQAYAQEWVAGS